MSWGKQAIDGRGWVVFQKNGQWCGHYHLRYFRALQCARYGRSSVNIRLGYRNSGWHIRRSVRKDSQGLPVLGVASFSVALDPEPGRSLRPSDGPVPRASPRHTCSLDAHTRDSRSPAADGEPAPSA